MALSGLGGTFSVVAANSWMNFAENFMDIHRSSLADPFGAAVVTARSHAYDVI